MADFLVAPRGESGPEELAMLLNRPENKLYAGHVHALPLNATYRNISSTNIRQALLAHEQEVPSEVRALYS